jgi:NAD(P)-dependent dehydrogenase (short-subunit alcohol dehydrogenase family)
MAKWQPDNKALSGKIAVVAGATRDAGRGIAAALGECGATVICTGRTTRHAKSEYNRDETIEETAELVTKLGGTGIAYQADHLDAEQVEKLAEMIASEYGHIDLLVNDIWGAEIIKGGPSEWDKPVWEHDLDKGFRILRLAIDTHIITARYLLPLLIKKPDGLHIEVSDGNKAYNDSHYRISVFYDLAKVSVNRLAFSLGKELGEHGTTAVGITPGWMRSEIMLENFGVAEENWREAMEESPDKSQAVAPPDFILSETPRFVGRAVASLAADPNKKRWHQQTVTSAQLSKEYGFTDLDGSRPDIWTYMEEVLDGGRKGDPSQYFL